MPERASSSEIARSTETRSKSGFGPQYSGFHRSLRLFPGFQASIRQGPVPFGWLSSVPVVEPLGTMGTKLRLFRRSAFGHRVRMTTVSVPEAVTSLTVAR